MSTETKKFWSRDDLRAEVRRMAPALSASDPASGAAVFLLAIVTQARGTPIKALAQLAGVDYTTARQWMRRAKVNGVVVGGELAVDWFDGKHGGIAFWLDVSVLLGHRARIGGGRK